MSRRSHVRRCAGHALDRRLQDRHPRRRDLEAFLAEQERYRAQLERYAQIMAARTAAVRLGLYFPLLRAWREWAV